MLSLVNKMLNQYKSYTNCVHNWRHFTLTIDCFLKGLLIQKCLVQSSIQKKLITSLVLKDSTTVGIPVTEKISMLLQGIESTTGLDPNCFDELMTCLRNHTSTTFDIASSIEHMLYEQSGM